MNLRGKSGYCYQRAPVGILVAMPTLTPGEYQYQLIRLPMALCYSILGSYHLGKLSKVHQESQYYFLNSICNDPKVKASTKRKEASKQAGGSGLSKSGSVNNGHEPSHSISPSVKWGRMRLYPKPW